MISDKEARQYILQQLYDEGYRYLARDESVFLYAYKDKPVKKQYIWDDMRCVSSCLQVHSFLCFKDIRWVDEEPLDITKELGIIDWTKVPKDTKVLVWDEPGDKKKEKIFLTLSNKKTILFLLRFIVMEPPHGMRQMG